MATVAVWVQSFGRSFYWVLSLKRPEPDAILNTTHAFYAGRGALFYQWEVARVLGSNRWPLYARPREFVSIPSDEPRYSHSAPLTPSPLNRVGVEWSNSRWSSATMEVRHFSVTGPCWLPVLVLALPPTAWGWSLRNRLQARRRAAMAFCPSCG